MKEFNLLTDVPIINNRDELKQWLRPIYIVSDYLTDHETYKIFYQKLYNVLKGCFVIYECRTFPIRFKFNKEDQKEHTMEFRHFILNLIAWYPFVELNDISVLDESFILHGEQIPELRDYINDKLITTLKDYHIKSTTINYDISEVLHNFRKISEDFSLILGLNFSEYDFIDAYNTNEEIRDMMECTFDPNMQPHEIEKLLQQYQEREIEIYKSMPENPIGIILRAGTGIKHKQFTEFTISEGLKPTIEGKTIPLPIENSTILRGANKPSYHFIDATGARKSLVMNKKVMGRAGYFGKIVLMLARTLSISPFTSDCNTKHLVEYDIKSKKILKKLDGKFYKLFDSDELKMIDYKKDIDLIGKKIKVRSPATCACGDYVCAKCIGKSAVINSDISDGYSAFESEEITKVVNQSILSAKHLLTTNSEVIEFNKDFYDFFNIVGGEVYPLINNTTIDKIEDWAIYINPDDMKKVDEMDEDSLYNTMIYNGRFYVRNVKDRSVEDIEIQVKNDKEIFITEEALDLKKKGKGLIRFKDMDDDTQLFELVILNNELTKPLYSIMNLLNKAKKDDMADIDESIDSICQKFLELLIESNISANVVAGELIINRLIRSVKDLYVRPNFEEEELEPYQIFTVSKALEKNKSPLIGLSFQNIKRQLLSDDLYEERNGTSYIDPFYFVNIPTDNLKKYSKIMSSNE